MAKSEYHEATNKEFGEPLKHDPTFKGPMQKRSCTDVICLLLFIAFIVAWAAVGIYAFTHGDPNTLFSPTDSQGLRCGVDTEVRDKPYLFFFDLTTCAAPDAIASGCRTPQVCVRKCPDKNFAFVVDRNVDGWKEKMICNYKVSVINETDAEAKIKNNICARYYLKSREVFRRCLPGSIDPNDLQELQDKLNNTAVNLGKLPTGQSNVNIFMQAKEMGQRVVQDLSNSWPFVVGGLAIAMVVCLIYIVLMRWFAGIMVWFSLLGTIALLAYCCYATYKKYDELKSAEKKGNPNPPVSESAESLQPRVTDSAENQNQILAMKDTWLAFLIISAIALVIVVLLVIFLRNRIRIAVALIKEGSKAVGSITSTLIFPLFPWILQLLVSGWFVSVLLFLAGSTHPVYKAMMDDCNCSVNGTVYRNGDVCDPDTFYNTFEDCLNDCNASCVFFSHEKEKYVDYLHAFNIFGVFWGLFFVSALGQMVLAGTFATWYWTFNKSDVPFFTVALSISRTFRYHLGTLAFGSLILAICRIIRVILEYINHKLSKYDNACVKALMCCLRCFFWCLEKFIKFINKNAYIMCAIYGKNFCRSAHHAFSLLMRNIIRVFVLDKVTGFLLFMGKLMITAGMCALAFYVFAREVPGEVYVEVPVLNYTVVPILIIGFGTYFIAGVFFGVYAMAVDTLFLCFLEDSERNDGSRQKPYYMSRELMKILHKKNK